MRVSRVGRSGLGRKWVGEKDDDAAQLRADSLIELAGDVAGLRCLAVSPEAGDPGNLPGWQAEGDQAGANG
jgi:hypothetical protein